MSVDASSEHYSIIHYEESVSSVDIGTQILEEDETISDKDSDVILERAMNDMSSSKPENDSQDDLPPEWSHHGCIMGETVVTAHLDTQPIENLLIGKCEQIEQVSDDDNIDIMDDFQSQEDTNGTLELNTEWNAGCSIGESSLPTKLENVPDDDVEDEPIITLESDEEQREPIQNVHESQESKSENEDESQELAAAWSEPGCIICNIDLIINLQPRTPAQIKEQNKIKNFFIEVMAVGQDIRLEEEDFFPFCSSCSQEVTQLMGMGYKIDFMHRQFDKVRDSLATKCVKTFIVRTKPELLDEDEEIMALPHREKRNRITNRDRVLDGWKRRYEVVQPGPKNPVMIRSMDSRGRVTVVRINSKGEAILPPERYPKRGGVDIGRLRRWEEDPEDEEECGPTPSIADTNIYKCPDCSKAFNSKAMLTYHSRIHSGELPFECEVCGRGFAVPHYLITHMRSHTGEKPFKCPECGKGFAQRGGLATHALVHTGAKPYVCPECGKSFRQKYHLTQHLLIHSGVKPFPCEICGKSFNVKMNLREHMRRHTGDRPYKCPYCTVVGFFRKKMLRDHITKIHPQRSLPEELLESSGLNLHMESILPLETIDDLSDSPPTMADTEEPECMDITTDDSNREQKFSV